MKNDIETEIFDKLLYDINAGKYKVNDKLPSENEIADMHHVSRIVVRKVYEELEELGYIYVKRGKGRYLNERYYEIELVIFGKESFSTKMKAKGYALITKNIAFEKIKYNEKIFDKLCVTKDDEVFKIARLRIVEGRSVAIHTSYVAKSVFNDIDKYGKSILSMFEYYKQHGYNSFKSSISVLSVSIPSSEERKNLECSKRIPVIILETDCIDTDSKVVLEYTKILYRGDCFKYNLM